MVLLYSSVGAIVGNAASAAMEKNRWAWFHGTNTAFALSLAAIPFVFQFAKEAGTYVPVIVVAVLIGTFFSVAANLAEGYYFRILERENEKEFGSSLYGIALSVVLAATMATVGTMAAANVAWQSVFGVLSASAALLCVPIASYAKRKG